MHFYFLPTIIMHKGISGRNLDHIITSEDMLGKKVIDKTGKFIGVSEKVFIDPKHLTFVGISVDKGALYRSIVIGKGYIGSVTKHAIFLKIPVALEMKGMIVFDKAGARLGIVRRVVLSGMRNTLKELHVKKSIFSKTYSVPARAIDQVGHNVILNVVLEEL